MRSLVRWLVPWIQCQERLTPCACDGWHFDLQDFDDERKRLVLSCSAGIAVSMVVVIVVVMEMVVVVLWRVVLCESDDVTWSFEVGKGGSFCCLILFLEIQNVLSSQQAGERVALSEREKYEARK